MHNLKGRQSAVLDVFSGLVTLAKPQDLPEGASPRNQNMDFNIGSCFTRDGLVSAFTYGGASVGPSPGGAAVDTPIVGGTPWQSPTNVLANDSLYASVDLAPQSESSAANATVTQGAAGSQWVNPQNLVQPSATTYVSLSGTAPAGTGSTTSGPGTVTQSGTGSLWSNPQNLTNGSGASASVGGSSGAGTVNSPGEPASGQATATANAATPTQIETVVASFANSAVYGNITLSFSISATFTGEGGGSVQVQYSTDGGSTWTSVYGTSGTTPGGYVTPSPTVISGVSSTNNFKVQLFVLAASGGSASMSVFGAFQNLSIAYATTGTLNPTRTQTLNCALGLSMPSTATYTGVSVSLKASDVGVVGSFTAQLTASGSLIGSPYTGSIAAEVSNQPFTLTATNLGISSLTAAQVNALGIVIYAGVSATDTATSITLFDLSATVNFNTASGPGQLTSSVLNVTSLMLALPAGATYAGVKVALKGLYAGSAAALAVQLTAAGTPVGTPQTVNLSNGSALYTLTGLGVTTLTATQIATLGCSVSAAVAPSAGATTVSVGDLVVTVMYSGVSLSDALDVTQFGFSVPPLTTPIGFSVALTGYVTAGATVTVQMLKAGMPVGTPQIVTLTASSSTVPVGGKTDLFGSPWTYADLNSTGFGVRIEATGAGYVYIGYITLTAYFALGQQNFDYVTTFEDSFGDIYTLALDASGQFWIEDVLTNPGVFNPLFSGIPQNSFASSFTADSRQYLAISDLLQGNYPPQQYNGQWNDRVSQVGPGAPPAFQGTLASGTPVTLTAYSVSGSIVTLTGANSLTAGEVITFNITAGPTFLNGQSLSVLGTGLSGTAFEVAFAGASGSGSATGMGIPQYTYPISASPNGITQYPAYPVPGSAGAGGGFDEVIISSGPGTLNSGNVVTCYYAVSGPDTTLVNAFQSGKFPVYVYISGAPVGNGTQLVTSVGLGTPPGLGHERYYFTFNVSTTGGQKFGNPSPGTYQMTVATLVTTLPLPGVETGDQVTLSGNGVAGWNETFGIVEALNSGSYAISQTSMAAGVATYSFEQTGTTSTPPVVGQLVTCTGLLNGNGVFNVVDAAISSVTGTTSGTFTVAGFAGTLNYTTQVEVGQATTSGTQFQIDPGPLTLGGTQNPIYGNSGGGYITLVGSTSIVIQPGTRRGVVFFITRNGYYTAPSPYVQFSTVQNTNYILGSQIPIGPPNVIARAIAFTEAGANNVPGASYYTIPDPVQFVLNGVTYTSSSLFINDNVTTTVKLTFTDAVLLNAEEIDIQGANLFNQGELGDAAWSMQYAGRSIWGRVRNKIQNFVNLSFDGGYNPNPGSNLAPLGWSLDSTYGTPDSVNLLVSPVFGNSFYIKNVTGSTQAAYGMITQSAYQDQNLVPILLPNTLYSVRVTVRTPSAATSGALVIDLTSYSSTSGYGQTYGRYQLNLSQMTSAMATYSGTILTTEFSTVPASLLLRLYAINLPNNADIEVDRVEIYPTIAPTNLTALTISYQDNLEAFDQVTGIIDTATVNAQPANGGAIIHDQAYIFKESSMGYISDSPNQEPAQWNPYKEVSNVAGACGINAFDIGEEWAIMACRNGLYGFNGGAPMPMMLEIAEIWNAIYWDYGQTICVRNDTENRRILIAVPMVTPNPWLPYAAANANPTTPNVVLMCNYAGIGSIEELMAGMTMHVTMMGKLAVHDLRRKWSLWTIPTPYMAVCKRSELDAEMLVCNGNASSKIYAFAADATTDDGQNIPWLYTTYAFVDENKAQENPMFGEHNKRFAYMDLLMSGAGTAQVRLLQNTLTAPYPWVVPGGVTLSDPANNDLEFPLDEYGMRMHVEISANTVPTLPTSAGCYASISRVTLVGAADKFAPIRGL